MDLPGNAIFRASILDFIHRLANQCSFLPGNASCTAVILDLRGSIWESLQHHRRSSEELPACSARRGNELPRPILIFVAAKRNGSACSGRSSDEVRVRFYSSLSRRRTVSPAVVVTATRSAFDSNLRSREEEWFRLQTATKQRLHRFLNSSSDLGITAGFCQETPSSVQ